MYGLLPPFCEIEDMAESVVGPVPIPQLELAAFLSGERLRGASACNRFLIEGVSLADATAGTGSLRGTFW